MKSPRHIAILLLILISSLGAAAQQSVESAIKSLENSKSVTNEIYSEKRNPLDKSIIRSDRMFEFTDSKIANKIIEAIRKERNKASEFQMNNASGRAVYTITFDNGKGPYSKYSLFQNGSGWTLAIVKGSRSGLSSKSRKHDHSSIIQIPADAFKSLQQLDGLKALEQLDGTFKNLQYDYIDGGKTVAISFASSSSCDGFNSVIYSDCDTDNCFTVTSCNSSNHASKQRKLAAKQRKLAAEQRELAAEQRKLAAKQRELAAEQRKMASKQREHAAKQRAKASEKRRKANQRWASSQTSSDGDTSFYTVSYTRD